MSKLLTPILLLLLLVGKANSQDINIYNNNGWGFGYTRSISYGPTYIPPSFYYYPIGNAYWNAYKREKRHEYRVELWTYRRIENAEARYRNRARINGADINRYSE